MNNKALETIKKYKMLENGDKVIVALSGGADSCALLHFLSTIRSEYGLELFACHVNHGLRGEEADKDETFAKVFCDSLNVRLFVLHANVAEEAEKRKISTELCGREIRYEFFERKAKELGAKIATAHTASDNLETVLFNLTRGSGLAGLCGIPPVRGNIIRPLIEVSRNEIEAYCRKNGINYVTDSTNLTREYTRNKLRLDVVPVLKEINPSVENTVSRLSQHFRDTDEYLRSSAQKLLDKAKTDGGYNAVILQSADSVVLSEAFRIICAGFEIIPEAKHIELLRRIVYNGGALEIRHNIFAVCKQGIFLLRKRQEYTAEAFQDEIPLFTDGHVCIRNKKISICLLNIDEFNNLKKIEKFMFRNSLDYDTIPLSGVFRTRRQGDSFSQMGRNCTKTVKKLMTEQKIPPEQRGSIILLADGSRVMWIEGSGVSEKNKVSKDTKRVLVIRCEKCI